MIINTVGDATGSLQLGETDSTAYRGDRGKIAYNHSLITSGNPHQVSKSDVGLGNVNNTSDANKPISTATQTALNTLTSNLSTTNTKLSSIISSIASVQSSSKASQAYTLGQYLIYNNKLYEVTTAIASGGTLTVGTNIKEVKISNILQAAMQGKQVGISSKGSTSLSMYGGATIYTATKSVTFKCIGYAYASGTTNTPRFNINTSASESQFEFKFPIIPASLSGSGNTYQAIFGCEFADKYKHDSWYDITTSPAISRNFYPLFMGYSNYGFSINLNKGDYISGFGDSDIVYWALSDQ